MSKKIEDATREVCQMIEELSDPSRMSLEEALEFYEYLQSEMEIRVEATSFDIKNSDKP